MQPYLGEGNSCVPPCRLCRRLLVTFEIFHTHTQIYMHAGVFVIGPGWRKEVPVTWAPGPGAAGHTCRVANSLTHAHTHTRRHMYAQTHLDRQWTPASITVLSRSSLPLLSRSHLNRLIRPYLAFLLALLSHDCCHRKKCAETQRLTPNIAHSIALSLFSIHSANAIFALFVMFFSPFFFYQPTFFFCCF